MEYTTKEPTALGSIHDEGMVVAPIRMAWRIYLHGFPDRNIITVVAKRVCCPDVS